MEKPRLIPDLIYNALIATANIGAAGRRGVPWEWRRGLLGDVKSRIWSSAWRRSNERYSGQLVRARVHGRILELNFGHPYPLCVQMYETYNAPLVELVKITAKELGHAAVVLDIGAGLGDTAALLARKCPRDVEKIVAIEGSGNSYDMLVKNLARLDLKSEAFRLLLSDESGLVPSLVPVHPGTASLVGDAAEPAVALDDVIASGIITRPQVVKVDVDGFDGKVLAGGRQLLLEDHPSVIFECSPQHIVATKSSPTKAFEVLMECGYSVAIWFDKFGRFTMANDISAGLDITWLERICLASGELPDWHFDVIALPNSTRLPLEKLAGLPSFDAAEQSASSILRWWHS